ncbi:kinesin-domain-containing protein [Rozella allomycis CSF55]|uniref:Kinesin-like protein n=1 Tax=Rozella allomycis (strain CSF55) TaxID=988480 RepID=A0A075AZA4_ROZAC|nr:Kinesin, motor region domain-containing protein [Rozella allomycis CSF55]RKP21314.1 kinesin-domain-containing protein [Rozella allomycis CSF55]|eukprot:EPZ35610.1 Kinesin, motor region domain-containing protein [Rozella allomycis CSF55]
MSAKYPIPSKPTIRHFPYEQFSHDTSRSYSAETGDQNWNFDGSSTTSSSSAFIDRSIVQSGKDEVNLESQIRVVVRDDRYSVLALDDGQTIQVTIPEGPPKGLTFHKVHTETCTQKQLFDESGVINLLDRALEGYSVTIFAYGQTSSGKTFTMTGPDIDEPLPSDQQGLIPRALHYIYAKIAQNKQAHYTVRSSYLEIYNEQVRDLLNIGGALTLPVRWKQDKGFYVENIFVVECDVLDDNLAVLEEGTYINAGIIKGLRNRKTGSHRLNENSSRSHSIMSVYLEIENIDPDDNRLIKRTGKISFVDLAGSEKVKESQASGGTFNEMLNINKSLLTLGNCISALSDPKKKNGHIPFRDSKLTKLLADSLGGNGYTLMIACISPSSYNLNESLKTLRYANRAKNIRNKPVIQMDPRDELIMQYKRENKILKSENLYLRNLSGLGTADLSHLHGDPETVSKLTATMLNLKPSFLPTVPNRNTNELEFTKKENVEWSNLQSQKNMTEIRLKDVMEENEMLSLKLERLEKVFLGKETNLSPESESSTHDSNTKPDMLGNKPVHYKKGERDDQKSSTTEKAPSLSNVVMSKQKLQKELQYLDNEIQSLTKK